MGEAPGLLPVAIHSERLVVQRLLDEPGHHHAVMTGLAGTDRVEAPPDQRRAMPLAPIRDGQELINGLGARVAPPPPTGRTQYQIAVLPERHVAALAVHLGRRRDEHLFPLLAGSGEHDLGGLDIRLNGSHRAFDDELHPHRGSEVEHLIRGVHQLPGQGSVLHASDDVAEARLALEMLDVANRAGRKVIDHRHLIAAAEQRFGEVRSDETSSACYEVAHYRPPPT